jgi:hypothetical protein
MAFLMSLLMSLDCKGHVDFVIGEKKLMVMFWSVHSGWAVM